MMFEMVTEFVIEIAIDFSDLAMLVLKNPD